MNDHTILKPETSREGYNWSSIYLKELGENTHDNRLPTDLIKNKKN